MNVIAKTTTTVQTHEQESVAQVGIGLIGILSAMIGICQYGIVGGYQPLPQLPIICSGLSVGAAKDGGATSLTTYKKFHEKLLRSHTWRMIARLGPGAFETISGKVVTAILLIMNQGRFTKKKEDLPLLGPIAHFG
jgi:hypothetical protein